MIPDLEGSLWHLGDLFGDWGLASTMLYRKCRAAGVKLVLLGPGSGELWRRYPQFSWVGGAEVDGAGFSRRALRFYQWCPGRRWGRELGSLVETPCGLRNEAHLFETRHQPPDCDNTRVDRAGMAASGEASVPFLGVRVADEGFGKPRDLLLREDTDTLRLMAERHVLLPPDISRGVKYAASMAASRLPGFRRFARDVVLDPGGWTEPKHGCAFPHPLNILSVVAWRLLLLNLWARQYLRAMA
jgi:asparagine synthetase B (glutamine-hydrolysing)